MRRLIPVGVLSCLALLLLGCGTPAEFPLPLSDPSGTAYDQALLGNWYLVGSEEGNQVTGSLIVSAGKNNTLSVSGAYFENETNDAERKDPGTPGFLFAWKWLEWTAYPTEIGGRTFYNARIIHAQSGGNMEAGTAEEDASFIAHKDRGYWIVEPKVDVDGDLLLTMIWDDYSPSGPQPPRQEVPCGAECVIELVNFSPAELRDRILSGDFGPGLSARTFVFTRTPAALPMQPQ